MQRHPMQTTHRDVQGVKALAPRIQAAEAVIAGAEVVCIYMEPAVRTGLALTASHCCSSRDGLVPIFRRGSGGLSLSGFWLGPLRGPAGLLTCRQGSSTSSSSSSSWSSLRWTLCAQSLLGRSGGLGLSDALTGRPAVAWLVLWLGRGGSVGA